MKKRVNPAWLPAGVYLGLGLLAAVVGFLVLRLGPAKQDVTMGGLFDRTPAVLVETYTGEVICDADIVFSGTVVTPRFKADGARFSGSLTVYPVWGDEALGQGGISYYEKELDLSLSPHRSAEPPPPGETPDLSFNKDYTTVCFGPLLTENWFGSPGIYYIIAPAKDAIEARAVLESIPGSPDLTDFLSPVSVALRLSSSTPENAEVTVVNQSPEEYMFGESYVVERFVDGLWEEVPHQDGGSTAVWHTVGYPVDPGESRAFSVSWRDMYGFLPSGEYRVGKNGFPSGHPEKSAFYYAEFTVH